MTPAPGEEPGSQILGARVCPACAHAGSTSEMEASDRQFGGAGRFWVSACNRCDTLFLPDPPDGSRLQAHYPSRYYAYRPAPTGRARRLKQRMDRALFRAQNRLPPPGRFDAAVRILPLAGYARGFVHVPGGRHLDIGCGSGAFLGEIQALGMRTQGVEPNVEAAGRGREQGLEIFAGDLEAAALPAGAFDVVTINHVIEHVTEPVAFLREVRRVMAPGGLAIVATPNSGSMLRRAFRRHWHQLDAPRHLQVFSAPGLQAAADRAGLRIDHVRWVGHPASICLSLAGALAAHRPPGGLGRPLGAVLRHPLAALLAAPMAGLLNVARLGDSIEVRMSAAAPPAEGLAQAGRRAT